MRLESFLFGARMRRIWAMMALSISVGTSSFQVEACGEPLVVLPNATYVFALSAPPKEKGLLLYASDEEVEGEFIFGTPILVQLGLPGGPVITPIKVDPVADTVASPPAWSPDGRRVYFLTGRGISFYDLETNRSELLFEGAVAGPAMSNDGSLLAFW